MPVIGDGGIASSVAEGRLVPVLILGLDDHPDVAELIRLHKYLPPGDATSQWGGSQDDRRITLILSFERPVEIKFFLLFDIESQGILVESILAAKAVYLMGGEPGDLVSESLDAPRILVEILAEGFEPIWDKLFLKRMTQVMATRLGVSRRRARATAEELIGTLRQLSRQRVVAPTSPNESGSDSSSATTAADGERSAG